MIFAFHINGLQSGSQRVVHAASTLSLIWIYQPFSHMNILNKVKCGVLEGSTFRLGEQTVLTRVTRRERDVSWSRSCRSDFTALVFVWKLLKQKAQWTVSHSSIWEHLELNGRPNKCGGAGSQENPILSCRWIHQTALPKARYWSDSDSCLITEVTSPPFRSDFRLVTPSALSSEWTPPTAGVWHNAGQNNGAASHRFICG